MFFVISNKPFLQTEGHRGYGTPILYKFSFLIFIFVLLTNFANAINRAAVKQVLPTCFRRLQDIAVRFRAIEAYNL